MNRGITKDNNLEGKVHSPFNIVARNYHIQIFRTRYWDATNAIVKMAIKNTSSSRNRLSSYLLLAGGEFLTL